MLTGVLLHVIAATVGIDTAVDGRARERQLGGASR